MKVYKFETVVLENGFFHVPHFQEYKNREVEIFIVLKPQKQMKDDKKTSMEQFLNEWTGFAKGVTDIDKSKYEYLMDKYK